MSSNIELIDKLNAEKSLKREEWIRLFSTFSSEDLNYSSEAARKISLKKFGNKIYIRGLIEFSNVCKNDCFYCGIRRSNKNVSRYRLELEDILACCGEGYDYGFRTFVLQSGEDEYYNTDRMSEIISEIKKAYPDCAVTLSLGEKKREDYQAFFNAGADRYLLRHETANPEHYKKLHPDKMSLENRMKCLRDLKEIGFQTGVGMMIGSPYQTAECLAEDMVFIGDFRPHMVGIGPFLPHKDTPFKDHEKGSCESTLFCLSLVRIMCPDLLLPATTALGTLSPTGRERGILSGANVIMPNLSPLSVRKKYMLYDNKASVGEESAQCVSRIEKKLRSIGYEIEVSRGDYRESPN